MELVGKTEIEYQGHVLDFGDRDWKRINYVEETLKFALGFQPNLHPKYRKHVYCQHIIINEEGVLVKVTGKKRALNSPHVEYVYVKPKKVLI